MNIRFEWRLLHPENPFENDEAEGQDIWIVFKSIEFIGKKTGKRVDLVAENKKLNLLSSRTGEGEFLMPRAAICSASVTSPTRPDGRVVQVYEETVSGAAGKAKRDAYSRMLADAPGGNSTWFWHGTSRVWAGRRASCWIVLKRERDGR